ncbi:MAG: trypsin-like serine peptidase [Bradymonadia bacterium]
MSPTDPAVGQHSASVIYGEDDRQDVYAVESPLWRARASDSVVALMNRATLVFDDPDRATLRASTLNQNIPLCEGERFAEQLTAADCSGTLIDEDLVLTAGHCIENQAACNQLAFVFGYHHGESPDALSPITSDDVYTCRELIVSFDDGRADYAIVQLDRPAVAHTPAPVRPGDGPMVQGESVTLIGFPSGLPAKVDTGGQVWEPRANVLDFFSATVDAFGGNSGSGVFDAAGNVVGILVRGQQDYVRDGRCFRVNTLPELPEQGEGAEGITYVARAIEAGCEAGMRSDVLCAGGGGEWCARCEVNADCANGWQCNRWPQAPEASWCAPPCMDDTQCRDDHQCIEGMCTPRLASGCAPFLDEGAGLWSIDACGQVLAPTNLCEANSRCLDGDCVSRPSGDVCADATVIEAVSQRLEGNLAEYEGDTQGSCAGEGPDQVYTFTLDAPSTFTATAEGFDTVLYLRQGCEGPEWACNDDFRRRDVSAQITAELQPGTYHLFVDAFDEQVGRYLLTLEFTEQCQDPCLPTATRCEGEDVQQVCVDDGTDCGRWVSVLCPPGEQCLGGLCAPTCEDECQPGERQCLDDRTIVSCTLVDGCGRWDAPVTCRPGRICRDEFCAPAPVDAAVPPPPEPDAEVPDFAMPPPVPDADLEADAAIGGGPQEGLRPEGNERPLLRGGRGCATGSGRAPTGAWLVVLLGALGLRRRSRTQTRL